MRGPVLDETETRTRARLTTAFVLATGLIIGWVSLAVSYIVGKAMHLGSGGVGGRRYQVVAVLLTYFAVSISAVPIADLRDPVHGLIGLIILFVGIRFAWQFTAGRTLNISGPYRAATAGPREVGGIWLS